MFEITLSTCKNREYDIEFIMAKIRPEIKSLRGILTFAEVDGRQKLALAVPENKKDYFIAILFNTLCEAIIKSYKFEYFMKNIKLHLNNKITEVAFLKALTMFDKNSDKEIIKKYIPLSGEVLIDSLYNFRLWELEKRWDEVIKLVEDNKGYLLLSGSFVDLMKFLILSIEPEIDEVHLYKGDGNIYCLNKNQKELFNCMYAENNEEFKITIISELITLAPEKIILHFGAECEELRLYIKNLFELKVEEK